jgi:hypothetical protein
MRMRKLGKGQSLIFCVPEEIKTKISSLMRRADDSSIHVEDVLCWAVSETWAEMVRSIPLWAVQGQRFERQNNLWHDLHGQAKIKQSQAERFLEPESQTLEQRYRPRQDSSDVLGTMSDTNQTIQRILDRCRELASPSFSSTQLQEEQERELAPEIEQERQVQRPLPALPREHRLDEDVRLFASTGALNETSSAFRPAFDVLRHTSAATHLDIAQFPRGLLVTTDFAETVQEQSCLDSYQRPVEWVLTAVSPDSRVIRHMLVISPFEANRLHSQVRKSKAVRMHIYSPRQNRSLLSLDGLTLYNVCIDRAAFDIPNSLRIQLNLFAGQLYISSYREYHEICEFLGVASVKTPSNLVVSADGFIVASKQQSRTTFSRSPLKCLKTLLSQIRKHGQEIDKTHLGMILDGKLLGVRDFHDERGTPTTMTLSIRT